MCCLPWCEIVIVIVSSEGSGSCISVSGSESTGIVSFEAMVAAEQLKVDCAGRCR